LLLTYANQLTILRLIFVPWFVLLILYGHPKTATLVFVLAAITDGLDGLLARKLQQKTELGQFLDPMADKVLLTAAFITLTIPSVPTPLHIPAWLTVLTISRDFVIALSALIIHLQTRHSRFPPTWLGKATTAMQLSTVASCLLSNFLPAFCAGVFKPLLLTTLLFTLASGFHYAYRAVNLMENYQRAGSADDRSRSQGLRS
jgi:cardiolipin synthase (CMP-forming)